MGFKRTFQTLLCAVVLACAGTAAAAPEPLIVTRLSDPERLIAASGSEAKPRPSLDAAMLDFGREIDQSLALQQQQIDARCRSTQAASASNGKRWAWAAVCRYQRR